MKIGFFVSPWLLFLIIPALGAIWAVFLIGKRRHSCTVNRVISSVLQSAVAVLLIFALSGIYFYAENSSAQNELVILVDRSFTTGEQKPQMDEYIRELLEENGGRCRTAIVLFGYDRKVALEMGDYGAEEAFEKYSAASETEPADDCATDIAGAVRLAWNPGGGNNLITNPSSAKILILSDGLQTDGDAVNAIKLAVRDGIQVDVAFYAAKAAEDASVTGITFPERNLRAGDEFDFTVNVYSAYEKSAVITVEDVDENGRTDRKSAEVELKTGAQSFAVPYSFASDGNHEIIFTLVSGGDEVPQNNVYYTFYDVAESNLMLIIEKFGGESEKFRASAAESAENLNTKINTVTIENALSMTARDLEKFSEIVLYNISESDMTEDFERSLYEYVHENGGGLFTVGGFEKDGDGAVLTRPKERDPETSVPVAHSYKEEDFENSVYSSMLPVTYDPYKPSVGVVFVIDASQSMSGITGAAIYTAIADAKHSLNLLSKNDYVGVIVLKDRYQQMTGSAMLPMTQKSAIEDAINEVVNSKGVSTRYAPALQHAADMLKTCPSDVVKKHIVLMSDAGPGDDFEEYAPIIQSAHETQDITLTVISYYKNVVEIGGQTYYFYHDATTNLKEAMKKDDMDNLARLGGGSSVFSHRTSKYTLDEYLAGDLKLEELEEVGMHEFNPKAGAASPITAGVTETELQAMTLKGFFPTRAKLDDGVEQPVMAEASPLYAQWKFGKGKVGSIMIDLEGVWSQDLLESDAGKKIINNIVSELFLRVEITRDTSLELSVTEDNFRTYVSVYGYDPKKEPESKLVAFVIPPEKSGQGVLKFDLSTLSTTRNRLTFENPFPGAYKVYVLKVPRDFNIMAEDIKGISDVPQSEIFDVCSASRTFSYSKEYDQTLNAYKTGQGLLASLSTRLSDGGDYGKFIYDAAAVYDSCKPAQTVTDPRAALLIAAVALYLAGIAVRKFKFPGLKRKNSVAVKVLE